MTVTEAVRDAVNDADVVFSGKVISIQDYRARFKVERVWKGSLPTYVTSFMHKISVENWGGKRRTIIEEGTCDYEFNNGESYLVYAKGKHLKPVICSRTKVLASAQEDLKELGEGHAPSDIHQSGQDAAHTLSEAQRRTIARIKAESEKRAAPAAARLAGVVSGLYANMLADRPDERQRAKLDAELKELTWELLVIKGQLMRDTVAVLTPEQKQLVKSEMKKPGAPADLSEVIARTFKLDEK